jgi:hypothetical protein
LLNHESKKCYDWLENVCHFLSFKKKKVGATFIRPSWTQKAMIGWKKLKNENGGILTISLQFLYPNLP